MEKILALCEMRAESIERNDQMSQWSHQGRILITGATGYVGSHLAQDLANRDLPLRFMVRRPERIPSRLADRGEVIKGDVLQPLSLEGALDGIHTAYYLIHSMEGKGVFVEQDRIGAKNFVTAAEQAGVGRIIYLGGLGQGDDLSAHLSSRQEVGKILRGSNTPTIELQASVIIGPGSLSFEMVRSLVDRLPVMITPRWVRVLAQPIAIEDIIGYLVEALTLEIEASRVYEIGGTDQVSYGGIMQEYARQRGLRRLIIPVPVLTPWLSSLWLGLVTPLYARVGAKLIDGVRNPSVVKDPSARAAFDIQPMGIQEAISKALAGG